MLKIGPVPTLEQKTKGSLISSLYSVWKGGGYYWFAHGHVLVNLERRMVHLANGHDSMARISDIKAGNVARYFVTGYLTREVHGIG